MSSLMEQDPEIGRAIQNEIKRQRENINLIASENFASRAVLEAQGSVFTNKYAEGYPGRRYYGGCEFVDVAESLAISRAKELFGAEACECAASQRGAGEYGGVLRHSSAGRHYYGDESGSGWTPDAWGIGELLG